MNASIANANPRLTLLEQQLEPLRKVEKSKLQARTLPLVRTWLDLQREAIRLDRGDDLLPTRHTHTHTRTHARMHACKQASR